MSNTVLPEVSFHHVALSVSDFNKSLEFYTKGLGFSLYRTWISGAGKKIALIDMGNGTYFEVFSDGAKNLHACDDAGSFFHLALKVKDTRAAFERALEYGAKPNTAPKHVDIPSDPILPVDLSFVEGPDGEQIEFFQPEE